MSEDRSISREELFRMVWSRPISHLQNELGVSNVSIAKACRRSKIPVPGSGYWQKTVESRLPAPPLPMDPDLPAVVIFASRPSRILGGSAADAQALLEPEIVVSEALRAPHPLLKWMPLQRHPWRAAGTRLNLIASKESMHRASRIMDALIKATEREGWSWRGDVGEPTVVTVDGVGMKIMVRERRVAKKIKNVEGSWTEYRRDLEWTGDIYISIEDWHARGTQKKWQDTSSSRLESMLRRVVVGIRELAYVLKVAREKREAENQILKLAWKKREAMERAQQEIHLKQEALVEIADTWKQADSLRRFLKSASDRIERLPDHKRAPAADWLRRALAHADAIDPLNGDWSWVSDEYIVGFPESVYE